jgi:hypothetical protein
MGAGRAPPLVLLLLLLLHVLPCPAGAPPPPQQQHWQQQEAALEQQQQEGREEQQQLRQQQDEEEDKHAQQQQQQQQQAQPQQQQQQPPPQQQQQQQRGGAVRWVWLGGLHARGAVVTARLAPGAGAAVAEVVDQLSGEARSFRSAPAAYGVARLELDGLEPRRAYRYSVRAEPASSSSSPGGSPDSSPGGSPDSSPGGSPGSSPGGSPGSSPGGSPDSSPGGSPGSSPGGSPGSSPGGSPSAGGAFRTPGPEGDAQALSFAFGSCADNRSDHAVFERILQHEPLVMLHLGDLHYGNVERDDPQAFHDMYDMVMQSARQRALLASVPTAYMYDDHDFGPNNSDQSSPGRESSLRAYLEAVPHYPLPQQQPGARARWAPGSGMLPSVFFAFSLARVRFVVTDTSSSKVLPATALGAAQREWLKAELAAAPAAHDLVFWATTMPWAPRAAKWGEAAAERREIAAFIAARPELQRRLVILGGDAHMLALDDGANVPGGVPLWHAAALDAKPTSKGGPYSHGIFPGRGQYGWVDVRYEGARACARFSGRRVDAGTGAERELLWFDTCDAASASPREPYEPSPEWVDKLWKRVKNDLLPLLPDGDRVMVFFDGFNFSLAMAVRRYGLALLVGLAGLLRISHTRRARARAGQVP